jgi:hypothetical protein
MFEVSERTMSARTVRERRAYEKKLESLCTVAVARLVSHLVSFDA